MNSLTTMTALFVLAGALTTGCGHEQPTVDDDAMTSPPVLAASGFMACMVSAHELTCWETSPPVTPYSEEAIETMIANTPEGRFTAVEIGWEYACVLDEDGTPSCWGPRLHSCDTPVSAPSDVKLTDIVVGTYYGACGLDEAGALHCWGCPPPAAVSDFASHQGIQDVSYGALAVCILDADGEIRCAGGYDDSAITPDGTFTSIDSGNYVHCALDLAGDAHCWGRHTMTLEGPFVSMSVGSQFCGIGPEGTLSCHSFGDTPALTAPTGVYKAVSVNELPQACALTDDDEVRCFGSLGTSP